MGILLVWFLGFGFWVLGFWVFGFLDFWGLARGSRVEMFRCGRCWFGVFGLCAGIRGVLLLLLSLASAGCLFWPLRRHPRFVSVLQASPLCGAAPTFLCRRKEK
ncbi:hypothetical protein C2L66_26440 [Paraburkholderia caribensis]|nr:hypothetical protein C2L66_26440 [Paraburkholderia caribensis]